MKNVLITGGLGFIGKKLCNLLVKENIKVTLFDKKNSNIKNSKILKFINGDILNFELLNKVASNCDTIFHFAAYTNVQESLKFPKKYYLNNFIGTANVVEICIKNNLNLVFSSSAAVYPLNIKKKISEHFSHYPTNPYGLTKKLSEDYIISNKERLKKFSILRFFNVYGKKQMTSNHYSSVIPKFISRAKTNDKMTINNSGKQKRDFIYIDDLVNICKLAAQNPSNSILNVGTGQSTSVIKLANMIKKILGKGKISKGKKIKNDALNSCANIKYLKKIYNINNFTTLEKGLRNIIND